MVKTGYHSLTSLKISAGLTLVNMITFFFASFDGSLVWHPKIQLRARIHDSQSLGKRLYYLGKVQIVINAARWILELALRSL